MRLFSLVLLAGVLLVVSSDVRAQSVQEETDALKKHIGAAPEAAVVVARVRRLPDAAPLRVYFAFGLDVQVQENFTRWAAKWNEKDAKKNGPIQIVDSIDMADIVLARFTRKDQVGSVTRSGVSQGTAYDWQTGKTVTRPVQRTYSFETVPVFAYILMKDDKGFLILERYSDRTLATDTDKTGEPLWNSLKELMKQRAKATTK